LFICVIPFCPLFIFSIWFNLFKLFLFCSKLFSIKFIWVFSLSNCFFAPGAKRLWEYKFENEFEFPNFFVTGFFLGIIRTAIFPWNWRKRYGWSIWWRIMLRIVYCYIIFVKWGKIVTYTWLVFGVWIKYILHTLIYIRIIIILVLLVLKNIFYH